MEYNGGQSKLQKLKEQYNKMKKKMEKCQYKRGTVFVISCYQNPICKSTSLISVVKAASLNEQLYFFGAVD